MADTLLNPIACNFASLCAFNANYDIVWSFQYSLCGQSNASAGFVTFLTENPTLTGGGIGRALGCGPSSDFTNTSNVSGVSGHQLSIAFDTTGLYSTSGHGFTTNKTASANSLIIRKGNTFTLLSAFQLSGLDTNFTLLSTSTVYNTLRFTLTNSAQILKIDLLKNNEYVNLINVNTSNTIYNVLSTKYFIGVSYATPVSGNSNKAVLKIKDFHIQGTTQTPTITARYPAILTG